MPVVALVLSLMGGADVALEEHATLRARYLLQAAEAYSTNAANKEGRFPATVADLNTPPFGGVSFLRNKEKDLIDPWGAIYRCWTDFDERGAVRFYVWTERVVD